MPELGSKISLISKADIRYEGRLFTVDPKECTIALASGEFECLMSAVCTCLFFLNCCITIMMLGCKTYFVHKNDGFCTIVLLHQTLPNILNSLLRLKEIYKFMIKKKIAMSNLHLKKIW